MKTKLRYKELTLIGSMLFGLFFGAGNLIFPIVLGAQAGNNLLPALIGLLITAVGIPLLGIVSIGISRSEGLLELSGRVSPLFRLLFTCALYLTIGPLFAIPRCAATSFTIGIRPLTGENVAVYQAIFTTAFFAAVLFFSFRPSKILDSVGKWLNPIFLVFLAVLLVTALVRPANSVAVVAPSPSYESGPLFAGFLQGYDTLDALASLAFGIIVVRTIRQLDIKEPRAVAANTVNAGVMSMSLMAVIYAVTALVGAKSWQLYADRLAEPGFTGGDAFAVIAQHYFGKAGILLLAIIVTFCCLKTAIGLVTSCSETFTELFPHSLPYKGWALVFTFVGLLISNIGLSSIIAFSAPVLYFLYPLAMVLIVVGIAGCLFKHARPIYSWSIGLTFIAAVFDLAKVSEIPALHFLVSFAERRLPLYSYGLGWICPALFGFIIGLVISFSKRTDCAKEEL